MDLQNKKGFTLIELLVVIAIIGVLSSIVFTSLTETRGRGNNSAVKSNLNNLRGQAEIIYDQNLGRYTSGLCTDTKVLQMRNAASSAGTGSSGNSVCDSNDNYWVVSTALNIPERDGSTHWCVDNNGKSKGEMGNIVIGVNTSCP